MVVAKLLFLCLLATPPYLDCSLSAMALDSGEPLDSSGKGDYYASNGDVSNTRDSTYYTTYGGGGDESSMTTASVEVESTTGSGTAGSTYTQYLSSYAQTWLELHNLRRKKYMEMYGYAYVPMMWSRVIARSAQKYADLLATGRCADYHHDPTNSMGENLAYTTGADNPEKVVTTWVEGELLQPNALLTGRNLHMTQVLWRATHYVGCATATNSECHLYVCRYVTPGNCNIGSATWLSDMMQVQSSCLPHCPPGEGCFSPADV